MSSDIRSVLQYVPQFAGRTFVIVIDEGLLSEPAMAETLLDLLALQRIGVNLVVIIKGDIEAFANWAVEMEFKSQQTKSNLQSLKTCIKECQQLLSRKQVPLILAKDEPPLGQRIGKLGLDLEATKLMILLREGMPLRDGKPIPAILWNDVQALLTNCDIKHAQNLLAAAELCASGIPRVHLLNGLTQGVLTAEIFSNEGVGTMVHTDAYLSIRKLREEDIAELLAMMGRSIRESHLIKRNYESIAARRDDFLVLTLDDNVVGCIALHQYPENNTAEIACLYVKHDHEGRGYGFRLAQAAEQKARAHAVKSTFALTTRAENFFTDKLGFQLASQEILPPARLHQLLQSGRDSQIVTKLLV